MPTEIKRAIRTADAWASDQSAMEALYGVGGYHTSISAFITWARTNYPNLVTSDVQLTAVCYDDWPSGLNDEVVISGFTTDATRYIKLTVAEGHRHNGTLRSGFWLWHANTGKRVITCSARYTQFEWLDAHATLTLNTAGYYCDTSGDDSSFLNCICETGGAGTAAYGFASVSTQNLRLYNCMSVGGLYGFWWGNNSTGRIYNCIATGASVGFYATATGTTAIDIRNTIAYNNTTAFQDLGTRWAATCTNNASTEAGGAPGANPIYSLASTHFVYAANKDFHLLEGSSLRDAGVNLYSTGMTFDIDGDERPSAGAWSVGYDHFLVATILPTLTHPTATNMTQTTARPRVMVAYA